MVHFLIKSDKAISSTTGGCLKGKQEILNPKHEILNKRKEKVILLIEIPMPKTFRILIFEFVPTLPRMLDEIGI
jgi:hypothetical protein